MSFVLLKNTIIFVCYFLYFTGIVSSFENKFHFDENCSIRDFISDDISRCISCYHTKTITANYYPCSKDRVSELPEKIDFLSHQTFTSSSGATCLTLNLETSEIQKLESVDVKIYWNRPLEDSDGFEGFDSNIIHRSTMRFLDYTQPEEKKYPQVAQKSSKRANFSVKFCGLFDFGSYDIRLLSHPNCYMRGLSRWYFIDLGTENKTNKFFSKKDPENPTNECPLPETLTTTEESDGDNFGKSTKPQITCILLVLISIVFITFCCLGSLAAIRYIFTKCIKKKPPETSHRRASVESHNLENLFDEYLLSKHGVRMSSCKDFTEQTSQQSSANHYEELRRPLSSLSTIVGNELHEDFMKKVDVKAKSLTHCDAYNTSNSETEYVEIRMSTSSL